MSAQNDQNQEVGAPDRHNERDADLPIEK